MDSNIFAKANQIIRGCDADASRLSFSPIGKPVEPSADMPLAKYVRECWENENGEPFYFMDWTKMI